MKERFTTKTFNFVMSYRHKTRVLVFLSAVLLMFLLAALVTNTSSLPPGIDLCHLLKNDKSLTRSNESTWWHSVCHFESHMDKPVNYSCKDERWMGNWRVCFDPGYKPRDSSCLVYSFGIANDFSFDEAMAAEGCTVYSFDPSMGKSDHLHSHQVYFKNLGLAAKDEDNFIPRLDEYVVSPVTWKVRTLRSIIKLLGHEQKFIDVLKFDVEGAEWEIMENILRDGMLPQIGQLLTEWHIFPDVPTRERLNSSVRLVTSSLSHHKLRLFYRQPFYRVHRNFFFNSQCDVCYINTAAERGRFQ